MYSMYRMAVGVKNPHALILRISRKYTVQNCVLGDGRNEDTAGSHPLSTVHRRENHNPGMPPHHRCSRLWKTSKNIEKNKHFCTSPQEPRNAHPACPVCALPTCELHCSAPCAHPAGPTESPKSNFCERHVLVRSPVFGCGNT